MSSFSVLFLLPSLLIVPVWSSVLAVRAPTPLANEPDALLQGWTPKPTTPPSFQKYGSIPEGELFARQDGGGQRTCGYYSGSGSAPVTCSASHSCTYFTQSALAPGNFGCCQVNSGTAGCAYVSTCLDYTSGGPGPTEAGVLFDVQGEVVYCGEHFPHCTGVQIYGNSDSAAPSNSFASWTCGLGNATIATAYLSTPFPVSTTPSSSPSPSSSDSSSVAAAGTSSSSTSSSSSASSTATPPPGGLSSGAEIGIGVGVGLAVAGALVGIVLWILSRRRRVKNDAAQQNPDTASGFQAYQQEQAQQQPLVTSWHDANKQHDGSTPWHVAAHESSPPSELPATERVHELGGQREMGELPGTMSHK